MVAPTVLPAGRDRVTAPVRLETERPGALARSPELPRGSGRAAGPSGRRLSDSVRGIATRGGGALGWGELLSDEPEDRAPPSDPEPPESPPPARRCASATAGQDSAIVRRRAVTNEVGLRIAVLQVTCRTNIRRTCNCIAIIGHSRALRLANSVPAGDDNAGLGSFPDTPAGVHAGRQNRCG